MRNIPFGRPIIGDEEKAAVLEVLGGPILVHGPRATKFEEKFSVFTGAPRSVSLSSCTAGLHLAYFYKGLGTGDEVIVPAMTHTATVHAVEFTGATPVFVDAELSTGNIDINRIEEKITDKTRAISVVHFLGMPVAMDKIVALAEAHDLFVVEDCALALGSYYKGVHVGLWGDCGLYSFYPVKHMTTAEGGMLITKHDEWADKITRQKAFGVDRTVGERKIPGVYDVTMLGYNYRMNEMQAAIGDVQLDRMPGFIETRRRNYETLEAALSPLDGIMLLTSSHGDFTSSHYCLSILLEDTLIPKRPELMNLLKESGVGVSVYYPSPVPLFSYYQKKYGAAADQYPVASRIADGSIALPVGPHLDVEDMIYIADAVANAIKKVG